FLDGDCLARRDFVAAHRALARPGWFVTGSRLLLSRELTADVLDGKLAAEQWSLATLIGQRMRGRGNPLAPLLFLRSGMSTRRPAAVSAAGAARAAATWRSGAATSTRSTGSMPLSPDGGARIPIFLYA